MTLTVDEAAQLPIVTDAQVEERVAALIGRACRRQLWLLFIDSQCLQLPVLMPCDDYPAGPDTRDATRLAVAFAEVMREADAAQIIFVWERRLGEAATLGDRLWAKALAAACRAEGVSVRGQLISHRGGVRWFAPEEYE
jgi:hypothetical protein